MAQFFIHRPVLAWVISIFIVIAGLIALPIIPVAQYPQVAPPQISIYVNYTGASPNEIYQSVSQPIEEELNGVEGLDYFESTSASSGFVQITATFAPGTDIARAQVDVQNALEHRRAVHLGGLVQRGVDAGQRGQVDDGAPAGFLPDAADNINGAEHGALVDEVDARAQQQVDEAAGRA